MQDFSSLKKKNAKNAAESPENKKRNEGRNLRAPRSGGLDFMTFSLN
jgi:hypothetical protein